VSGWRRHWNAATARHLDSLEEFNEKYGDTVLTLALDVTDKTAVDTGPSSRAS
jgi:NADP-dependent 3-hydroxy acid dehydrogenase YdfG